MYLKRLELHGFKSFASPTPFEFAAGVTCVVGPNGAGKTNVAEAIRWVLGEHASRVIRARKTEDVIFSGSSNRSPMGMAEVRLTLDNSDGWLPLDFEEVVVSRRAFRSGENEYYINQSRVRLKDVTELFLKAQIGQNSYAFMGQGLVEEVLTLRPEERRGLIEEAADVRLHRTRLDEARNRLAATRENLDRAALIVAEIEPRLRQLERQADRAASQARLSTELAQALQTWFSQQWQEAQETLAASRAAWDQSQGEFDRARSDVAACEEGLSALLTAIEERRRDITEREEAYRTREDYRRDLQRRITMDDERQTMMASRHEELLREVEAQRSEREELAGLLAQHEERARALEEELNAARLPEADVQEAEQGEARLRDLRQALAAAEGEAAQAGARLVEAEARMAALREQRQRLQAEMASLERDRIEQMASLKTWASEFATRRQQCTQMAPAVQRSARTLAETETRLTQASAAVARRQEEIRTLSAEIDSAEVRLEAAQASQVNLPTPDAGVRALLQAGGRVAGEEAPEGGRIEGMVGMVGELLRVPAGLERAIEAALADSLHAIVVERQEDALAAIELLVSEDLGRATIIPLSDVGAPHPLNLMEERGVLGVASELVRCDHRFRPLVDALLGRTIVVENLGVARRLLRRGLGSVVTLDGILSRPQGSITAGSAKVVRQSFVHQREVGELPQQLTRLRAAHDEASGALEQGQRALAEAQLARDGLAPELERLRAGLASAEDAFRHQRARLPSAAARLSALHARRHDAQRALSDGEHALEAAQGAADRASAQAEEHQASRDGLRSELEELAASQESHIRTMAGRTARLAALEAEQEPLRQFRQSQAASMARVEQELTHREELIGPLEEELKTVQGRLEAARRELEEISREAEVAREELEPARSSVAQLESRQRAMSDELVTARSRSLAAERALLDGEATVRLRSEELESLRERLQEEGFSPSSEGEVLPLESSEGPPAWLAIERPSAAGDDEPPPMRGGAQADAAALKDRIGELRSEIRRLGPVNEQAETDYAESRERYDFLTGQIGDLEEAEASLLDAIQELERIIKERFSATFQQVQTQFQRYFETFFGGGQAELVLTKPDERGLPGVEIMAQPPRKRVRSLHMLSGGERSLTAVALLFALLHIHPSPICVLDEVDAALDEANVGRFTGALRELAERTQFIIITHNRRTIEMADTIYGVSMGEDSVSTLLSLRLSDLPAK